LPLLGGRGLADLKWSVVSTGVLVLERLRVAVGGKDIQGPRPHNIIIYIYIYKKKVFLTRAAWGTEAIHFQEKGGFLASVPQASKKRLGHKTIPGSL
jgi:hypothetical protein